MSKIDKLEQMIVLGLDSAELRFGLAQLYFQKNDWHNAFIHAEQAILFSDTYASAYLTLGKCYQQLGESEHAKVSFLKAYELAVQQGDIQLSKVLNVLLRRLNAR